VERILAVTVAILLCLIGYQTVYNKSLTQQINERESLNDSLLLVIDTYDSIQADLCEVFDNLPVKNPLKTVIIDDDFGWRRDPITKKGKFHRGLDLKGSYRDTVYATGNGRVIKASWKMGYGRCVVIQHADEFRSLYAHLSKIFVSAEDTIKVGEPIGRVGSSGRSTGSHLHYEVLQSGYRIDPCGFLDPLTSETNCQ
jgi:murein DD-endopeptidase MepM/ murein hydrolase activator NlpD